MTGTSGVRALGGRLGDMGAMNSVNRSERAHTVPGTVEIGSEHEVDTSAAVPGTDMLPDYFFSGFHQGASREQ